ncbi:hypothetical protein [Zavarzinia aquatilis]|uniref:Uncharacterized protein n=1 Tax=Zavarzinia aquatilis TaxID=2211142 RepID=A0A317DXT6_9PROT|nr:hypothetical protein [Zavarzinia aquatilis]PWR17635.1 hypothetical protein DKG74_20720 [Zavarzinia aquatilis]
MTDTPKPTEGGRYELIDGQLVQHQAPTEPGEGGPRNADGSSMYTTDKFRPAPPASPAPAPVEAPIPPADAPAETDAGETAGAKKKR